MKISNSAQEMIAALALQEKRGESMPYSRRVFRSIVKTEATKQRQAATSMLFLQTPGMKPVWRFLRTDEVISYHAGTAAVQILIQRDGSVEERIVGPGVLGGEFPQSVIPAWTWLLQFLPAGTPPEEWGLFGSMVSPGFDPVDMQETDTPEILKRYPDAEELLRFHALI